MRGSLLLLAALAGCDVQSSPAAPAHPAVLVIRVAGDATMVGPTTTISAEVWPWGVTTAEEKMRVSVMITPPP